MPTILAIDLSTEACAVGLLYQNSMHEFFEVAPRRHAELVITVVDGLLVNAGITLKQVDAIAFGCGPGSFMGVRTATAVAQGLAFGGDCPVIPVSTLQTLAQTIYEKNQADYVLAGWDARMGEIYWGAYRLGENGLMQSVIRDRLDKPAGIEITQNRWLAAGNAWKIYDSQLPPRVKNQFFSVESDAYPHAQAMLTIARERYNSGALFPPEKAEPVYLRDKVAHVS